MEVVDGDYNGLVNCMGHLIAVRDRQTATDEMFEPLKETIELLKTYNQEMPEEVESLTFFICRRNRICYCISMCMGQKFYSM